MTTVVEWVNEVKGLVELSFPRTNKDAQLVHLNQSLDQLITWLLDWWCRREPAIAATVTRQTSMRRCPCHCEVVTVGMALTYVQSVLLCINFG